MRRRAASGEAARGGLVFQIGGGIRCAGRPQEWSCGAVPPREWTARGGVVFQIGGGGISAGKCVEYPEFDTPREISVGGQNSFFTLIQGLGR